jgi:hypothetical protein
MFTTLPSDFALKLDNVNWDKDYWTPIQQAMAHTLFSEAFFNPPGQAYVFRGPTVEEYLASWSNLFSPCQ